MTFTYIARTELQSVLAQNGIVIKGHEEITVDQFLSLCETYELSPDSLVAKWESFCLNQNIDNPTAAHVTQFVQSVRQSKTAVISPEKKTLNLTPSKKRPAEMGVWKKDTAAAGLDEFFPEDDLLMNLTPSKVPRTSYSQTTPNSSPSKSVRLEDSPLHDAYKSRGNTGTTNVLIGQDLEKAYPVKPEPCLKPRTDIALFPESVFDPYRHMFQKIAEKSDELNDRITNFGAVLTKAHKLTDIVHPSQLIQNESFIIGRICCDAEGKLNENSVELESSREMGGGVRTKVDLSQVASYGLFPGQIVALEGTNISGKLFTATKVIQGTPAPMQTSRSTELRDFNYGESKMNGRPMSVIFASGPYTLSDNLNFQPFADLINKMEQEKPDVLILAGPFLDAHHEQIKQGLFDSSLTDLFKEVFSTRLRKLRETSGTQVILVPSLQDIHHPEFVFPQVSFEPKDLDLPDGVLCFPNPVTFYINEVAVGIVNTDVIFHLSNEETSKGSATNRIAKLASFLIDQRSYYPLFPPRSGTQLELSKLNLLDIPVTPDIIFFSSNVVPFAKDVDGVLCVNSGKLTKVQQAGTYSKLTIFPMKKTDIPTEDTLVLNRVAERTKVESIKL